MTTKFRTNQQVLLQTALGVAQTVTFDKKGNVFGDSGCNRFTGR